MPQRATIVNRLLELTDEQIATEELTSEPQAPELADFSLPRNNNPRGYRNDEWGFETRGRGRNVPRFRRPMIKIAFAGKGGSGKSSISGTFARVLARQGRPVLALDSDPVPGMPFSLGIPVDDSPTPDDVVVEGPEDGPRWVLRPGLDAEQFISRHAAVGPDGVRYLQFGNTWGHISTLQRAQFAWSQVIQEMDPASWNVVGDLPGGTRQAMFGWAKYASLVAIVVEPTAKSIHVGRRLRNISKATWGPENVVVIINKVEIPSDVERIEERLQLPVIAVIPADPMVVAADKRGWAPLDHPAGRFVEAIEALVATVEETYDE